MVGEEFFGGLARAYGAAYPSKSGDLTQFGACFAEFLRDFPHVAQYRYFPDVARLEWALHQAHYAVAAQPIDAAALLQLAPQQLDAARLEFHPACSLIACETAAVPIWRAHQTERAPVLPKALDVASFGLIVRPQWRADVLALSRAAHGLLACLQAGATLGEALDVALAIDAGFDFGSLLQQCLGAAVFADVTLMPTNAIT